MVHSIYIYFHSSRFLLSEKDCNFIRNYIIRNGNFVFYSHFILLIFQRNCFVYIDKISLVYSMTNKVLENGNDQFLVTDSIWMINNLLTAVLR